MNRNAGIWKPLPGLLAIVITGIALSGCAGGPGKVQTSNAAKPSKFTVCMQAHGYAKFPDINPGVKVSWARSGIDPKSRSFRSAMKACGATRTSRGWLISSSLTE